MAKVIDGKAFAAKLREDIKHDVDKLKSVHNLTPGLAVVLVGEDPASHVYVRNKARQTEEVGMRSIEHRLPDTTSQEDLMALVEQLNNDNDIHGILVQLPLPKGLDDKAVINAINVAKDVDGFHIENVGKLSVGEKSLVPCTPLGCLMLLQDHLGDLSGKHAVIIGRSNIVGKPMANLLLQNNCTVSIVHSRTENIKEICLQADILVAAVGRAEMVDENWVKDGAVVIDVGINRIAKDDGKTKIVGDVNFTSASNNASAITPVPGGVGPMTIACLLYNTVQAAARQKNISL